MSTSLGKSRDLAVLILVACLKNGKRMREPKSQPTISPWEYLLVKAYINNFQILNFTVW